MPDRRVRSECTCTNKNGMLSRKPGFDATEVLTADGRTNQLSPLNFTFLTSCSERLFLRVLMRRLNVSRIQGRLRSVHSSRVAIVEPQLPIVYMKHIFRSLSLDSPTLRGRLMPLHKVPQCFKTHAARAAMLTKTILLPTPPMILCHGTTVFTLILLFGTLECIG